MALPDHRPDLSIIIVNYNGGHVLDACLRSISDGVGALRYDLWVVDNGSSDGSLELARALCPQAQILCNVENRGFAYANNQALRLAQGRFKLLLNNDTIVHPGALEAMIAAMESHPDLGGLGLRLLNRDGSLQLSCFRFPTLLGNLLSFSKARLNRSGKFVPAEREAVSRVEVVTGACLLLRSETLDEVGLLDDGYFMYSEEVDWCYRATRAGWAIGYLPTAEVIHLGGQTAQREADRFYVQRRYSRVRYQFKHHGRLVAGVDAASIAFNLVLHWLAGGGGRARSASLLRDFGQRTLPLLAGPRPQTMTLHAEAPAQGAPGEWGTRKAHIVQMTSVHIPFDNRIFHKQCKSLAAAGYRVTLIAPHTHDETIDGVHVRAIAKASNRWVRMARAWVDVYTAAMRAQGDLYHFHDPELLPVGVLLRLRTGKPVVYDIHEDYVASIRQRRHWPPLFRELLARLTDVVEPLLARACTLVLAERYYARRFPAGHPILNYPSLDAFEGIMEAALESGGRTHLIYTGTVSHDRGALLYAQLVAQDPQIEIDVIGRCSPSLEAEMRQAAGAAAERLHLVGSAAGVPFQRIVDAYRSGDHLAGLAVFPPTPHYVDKELTKFYEYMAAGLPVIYSAFPTWRALLEPHQAGLAVDPHDLQDVLRAVRLLRENPQMAAWMGANGRRAVLTQYNWEQEAQKLIALYEQLLPCSARAASTPETMPETIGPPQQ